MAASGHERPELAEPDGKKPKITRDDGIIAFVPVTEVAEIVCVVDTSSVHRCAQYCAESLIAHGFPHARSVGILLDRTYGRPGTTSVLFLRVSERKSPFAMEYDESVVSTRRLGPLALFPEDTATMADTRGEEEERAVLRAVEVLCKDPILSVNLSRAYVMNGVVRGDMQEVMGVVSEMVGEQLGLRADSKDPRGTDGYVDEEGNPIPGPFEGGDPSKFPKPSAPPSAPLNREDVESGSRAVERVVPDGFPLLPPWPFDEDRRPVVVCRLNGFPRKMEDTIKADMLRVIPSPWRAGILAPGVPATEEQLPTGSLRDIRYSERYASEPRSYRGPVQLYLCRHDALAVVSLVHVGWTAETNTPLYLVGVMPPEAYHTHPDSGRVVDRRSRAFYKIREALVSMRALPLDMTQPASVAKLTPESFTRALEHAKTCKLFNLPPTARGSYFDPSEFPRPDDTLRDELPKAGHAPEGIVGVDIGASPGGWSEFLVTHCGASKVYAIDPAELDPALPPQVEHIQRTAEDAVPILVERGVRADILVCDVNLQVDRTVGFARTSLPLLRPGALVILTFKHTVTRGNFFLQRDISNGVKQVLKLYAHVSVRRLLANGREVTIFAIAK